MKATPINSKPQPENFGYENPTPYDEGGWMIEGGEKAYQEALQKWEAQNKPQQQDWSKTNFMDNIQTILETEGSPFPDIKTNEDLLKALGREFDYLEYYKTIVKSQNRPICEGLNVSAQAIYQANKAKGFWDSERNVGELLMLITSELGEAMEAHRKGKFASKKYLILDSLAPQIFEEEIKDSFEDEIADAIIRLLDMCGGLGIDIEKHINLKVAYNATRPRLHGKKY